MTDEPQPQPAPEPPPPDDADDGSGPSSHETSGQFPADEVAATHESG